MAVSRMSDKSAWRLALPRGKPACAACQAAAWKMVSIKAELKWCKKCKEFLPLVSFCGANSSMAKARNKSHCDAESKRAKKQQAAAQGAAKAALNATSEQLVTVENCVGPIAPSDLAVG